MISIFLCFPFLSFHICLKLKCPNLQWYKISMAKFAQPSSPKWGQKPGWKDHWTRRHQGWCAVSVLLLLGVCGSTRPARFPGLWNGATGICSCRWIKRDSFMCTSLEKPATQGKLWGDGTKQVCKATWSFMQTVNGAERRGGQAMDTESSTPLLKNTEATVGSTQTSNVFQTT